MTKWKKGPKHRQTPEHIVLLQMNNIFKTSNKTISYCIGLILSSGVVRNAHAESENKGEVQVKIAELADSYM